MPEDNMPSNKTSNEAGSTADALALLKQTEMQLDKALLAVGVAERAARTLILQAKANERPSLQFGLAASQAHSLASKTVALHVGDGMGADFHVDLWLEHMEDGGRGVLVIVRSQYVYNSLKERPGLDVVFARESRDAEVLIEQCPNMKAILYASNTGNTIQFLRHSQLTHIFVGHGDSEKASSCHKYFRVYDEVWTAGQAHIDRFKNSGIDFRGLKFVVVGRPALKSILENKSPSKSDRFLYLPTWEGFHTEHAYTSIDQGVEFMRLVASATGKRPVIKFHPWTGKQDETLADSEDVYRGSLGESAEVLERTVPAVAAMQDADFLIADISSVVTDFLPTQRPIFLFTPKGEAVSVATSSMPYSEYCYEFSDADQLSELIKQVIVKGKDALKEQRRRALDYFIDVGATESNAFRRELDRVTRGA